jgi:hypothetical protein
MRINSIAQSIASLFALFPVLTTSSVAVLSIPSAEAIEVKPEYRGKVCIYVPKSYVLSRNHVTLEVYWGAHTMRRSVSASQFPNNTTNLGGQVGVNSTYGSGASSDQYSSGRYPDFGLELEAYGNNVRDIYTNFEVVGFEHQGCKSDYNLTMY